jgi:hypothetical protein
MQAPFRAVDMGEPEPSPAYPDPVPLEPAAIPIENEADSRAASLGAEPGEMGAAWASPSSLAVDKGTCTAQDGPPPTRLARCLGCCCPCIPVRRRRSLCCCLCVIYLLFVLGGLALTGVLVYKLLTELDFVLCALSPCMPGDAACDLCLDPDAPCAQFMDTWVTKNKALPMNITCAAASPSQACGDWDGKLLRGTYYWIRPAAVVSGERAKETRTHTHTCANANTKPGQAWQERGASRYAQRRARLRRICPSRPNPRSYVVFNPIFISYTVERLVMHTSLEPLPALSADAMLAMSPLDGLNFGAAVACEAGTAHYSPGWGDELQMICMSSQDAQTIGRLNAVQKKLSDEKLHVRVAIRTRMPVLNIPLRMTQDASRYADTFGFAATDQPAEGVAACSEVSGVQYGAPKRVLDLYALSDYEVSVCAPDSGEFATLTARCVGLEGWRGEGGGKEGDMEGSG